MPAQFTDNKAKQILQRAAEIDRVRSDSVSEETLRAAAREAGIAEASFDAAVNEMTAGKVAADSSRITRRGLVVGGLAAIVLAMASFMFMRGVAIETQSPAPQPPDTPLQSDVRAPRR